jgi:transcriptional regulator with XRE-family HTH domain
MTTIGTMIEDRYGRNGTEFIDALRSRMSANHVTQAALARAAGVCPTQISRWFAKRVEPSLVTRIKLDTALEQILNAATEGPLNG